MDWLTKLQQGWSATMTELTRPRNRYWLAAGALLLIFFGWRMFLRTFTRRIISAHKILFGERHQYIQVRANDFPFLDQTFYNRTRDWLVSQRFVHAGDLEDITLTRRFPKTDTFYRVMLGDGGATAGICYHWKVRGGWARFKRRLLGQPVSMTVVEFSTELEDGTFIISSTGARMGGFSESPHFVFALARPDSMLNEILEPHREKVFQVLGFKRTRTRPRMNIDAMIHSLHRAQDLRIQHHSKVGWVDTDELRRIGGGVIASALARDIDRVQKAAGFKPVRPELTPDMADDFDEMEGVEELDLEPVPVATEPERNIAELEKIALRIFDADEELDDSGDMKVRWDQFSTALKKAINATGVEHEVLIAMPMDGSEIGIGRMHGVKPYLCFNRPDESSSIDNFKEYFLEGTMYDPPFSRIGVIVVGLDHNHLLYVLLEFLEDNPAERRFTLSFDPDWDKPTVLYLESDVDSGHAKPFDARTAM